jgi:hypothetical protein
MADPVYLRLARNKAIATALVIGLGYWWLWPDEPVRAWLQESHTDWRYKFAFIGWGAVSLGMIYDTVTGFIKAFKMAPTTTPRRR